MGFRRVVTGHASDGKSVIVADEFVSSIDFGRGAAIDMVWSVDAGAVVPNDGAPGRAEKWFPDPGGMRVIVLRYQPAGEPPAPPSEDLPDMGLTATYESGRRGVHTSDTIDIGVILSGELWLELDDGVATRLTVGDVVIQNGTRHRWQNRSEQPTTMLGVVIGATRRAESGPGSSTAGGAEG
ncbi:MAG: cupin domain-containing protein [Acidimicrobiia bacterium]